MHDGAKMCVMVNGLGGISFGVNISVYALREKVFCEFKSASGMRHIHHTSAYCKNFELFKINRNLCFYNARPTLRPLIVGGLIKKRGLAIFPEEINGEGVNKWKWVDFVMQC